MSRGKELAKNTLILFFGTFLPKLSSIITLPIITGGLTKVEYGTYDLIGTLISLLFPIVTLQIHSAAFRFLIDVRGNKVEESKIVTNLLCFIIPSTVIFSMIIIGRLGRYSIYTKLLITLYFCVECIFASMQQIIRGFSKNIIFAISSVATSILNLLLVVLTVLIYSQGLYGVVLSIVVATSVGLLVLIKFGKILDYFEIKLIDRKVILRMLTYSWPIVPNTVSNWILSASDRFVLSFFWGIEVEALYAIANKIPALLVSLQGTFTFAWQESASLAANDEDVDLYYTSMFDRFICLLSGCLALLISFAPFLFKLLIRGEYNKAYKQVPILFMGVLFSCVASFMGGIYVAHKRTRSIGITTIIAAGVNLIVDLILIRHIGIFAASLSTLISYMLLTIYRMKNVRNFQYMEYNYRKIIFILFCLVTLCILCWINKLLTNIVSMIISIIFSIIINRDLIKLMLNICYYKFLK